MLGVFLIGALLFGAYSAASTPLPEGFPVPTVDGQIDVKQQGYFILDRLGKANGSL